MNVAPEKMTTPTTTNATAHSFLAWVVDEAANPMNATAKAGKTTAMYQRPKRVNRRSAGVFRGIALSATVHFLGGCHWGTP
jgi:hypothetical protein